nr:putative ribonuclease H-like domain-containing protein [Tanacetum cinerariifolium]
MVDMLPLEVTQRVVRFLEKEKSGQNSVLFTDTECLVLSPDFKLPDESQVLLRVPRENNMYNVNLKSIVPSGDLTCLFAKATIDESNLWHRREFIVPRTPQQNGIAERKNRTLIEAARTMLVDSLLPIPFWAEVVDTACYVQNRVLVTKPHSKTPYELLHGRTPSIGFMRPFSCPVTILNTLDSLGKFNGKVDENNDRDVAFDGKEPDFNAKKPESKVIVSPSSSAQSRKQDDKNKKEAKGKSLVESFTRYRDLSAKFEDCSNNSINKVNAIGTTVPTVGQNFLNSTNTFSAAGPPNAAASPTHGKSSFIDTSQLSDGPDMPELEDITYSDVKDDVGAEADFNNLETSITVSPIPTSRIYKDHPMTQIIGDLSRSMTKVVKDQGGLSQMFNDDFHTCMFACFLLQEEPKRDERGIVVRNKARLVAQGHTYEEGIDYEEVFAPVTRIEAIRLFLAYASFMGFMVYQMDVKSAFLYETIEEEVYVCQPPVFEDPDQPNKVYKVVKADKYVAGILRKFGLQEGKSASTTIDTEKPLLKDPDGEDVDVHTYRSMIGSLMYLTSSRPDIMFAVCACACARFQVTLKASHLHAVNRIFRYLKGKSHLGLWYIKDSPIDLVAYSDSDYAGASMDRKSTTGGCQFLGCRLISWQCKKQTVVATSSTKAEYVAVASCCAQVLWIQNQLLDYGKIISPVGSQADESSGNVAAELIKPCRKYKNDDPVASGAQT